MTHLVTSKPKTVDANRTIKLLIHDPTIARFLRLLESTSGVDKLIRTVQFVSRFIAFYSSRAPASQPRTGGLAAIRKQFGLSRKLLRFGNSLASFRALAEVITDSSHTDFVDKWTAVAQHAGFAAFSTVDSATYLPDAGICSLPHLKLLEKLAFIFWLWALIASIMGGLYRLLRIRAKLMNLAKTKSEEVDKEEKTRALQGESKEVRLQILGAACDALFPSFALNFPLFKDLNDGMLGLAGSISSFTGLRSAWNSTKI